MADVGETACGSGLWSASALPPPPVLVAPNWGAAQVQLVADCSHRCSSSNWPGPRTSVMCSVAGLAHFWHLCIAAVPGDRLAPASSAILTRGLGLSRNRESVVQGAALIRRGRRQRLGLFLQAVAAVDLGMPAAFRTRDRW